jgi:hypothetical protein
MVNIVIVTRNIRKVVKGIGMHDHTINPLLS